MKVTHELEPFYNDNSKILILGSIPSIKSRELGFYYMHPSNRFWQVLEKVFDEKIIDKKTFLIKHHIALWDVIKECDIKSSSDSTIKNVVVNDINELLNKTKIDKIFTTGSKANILYQKYLYPQTKIKNIALPSTSSANAKMNLETLVKEYMAIKS